MLIFWSLVRNSVVLAVYLLFSVACFLTVHEHSLQVCLDSGAKKILLPITSAADLSTVPAELIGCFNLIFYQTPEDAVFKALGVE